MPQIPDRDRLIRMVGRRMRDARLQKGYSLRDMAENLPMLSYQWFAKNERPGPRTNGPFFVDMISVADTLGVSLDYLADRIGPPARKPETLEEWQALYPGQTELAQAHWLADKNWNYRRDDSEPSLASYSS